MCDDVCDGMCVMVCPHSPSYYSRGRGEKAEKRRGTEVQAEAGWREKRGTKGTLAGAQQ